MASTLNLAGLKTPGVYLDEVALFPPSVAQVETAIPAFIGPTRQHLKDGTSVKGIPTKVKSLVEFRRIFGGEPDRQVTVTLDALNAVQAVDILPSQYLFDSLQMFFGNGGEKCYIVSTGMYTDTVAVADYTNALNALRKYDEPTLLVFPDAVSLTAAGALATVQQAALDHAAKLQDRFAVLDVRIANPASPDFDESDADTFRNSVTNNLKYGAAYYPYLKTSLPLVVTFAGLTVRKGTPPANVALDTLLEGAAQTKAVKARNTVASRTAAMALLPGRDAYGAAATPAARKTFLNARITAFTGAANFADADVQADYIAYKNEGSPAVPAVPADPGPPPVAAVPAVPAVAATADGLKLTAIKATVTALTNTSPLADTDAAFNLLNDYVAGFVGKIDARMQALEADLRATVPLYATIAAAAEERGIVLPPSGAVVGAYAAVDNARGVWKAPANWGLNYVVGPTVMLTDDDQAGLNVDVTAGKSINAIRAFTGKGTLIWGARTLAGSDNEWRYVSVRRFFIMVEESTKKASGQFVFEPNDANTWVKIRAMIENFLTLQWRAGALAGVKAEHAFFVRVGLGQTMTAQDILEGRLIVEIGMAVVRPAEFIVLRFSHKMQES